MKCLITWPGFLGNPPSSCGNCGTYLKNGTIFAIDDYLLNQPYQIGTPYNRTDIQCVRCGVVEMVKSANLGPILKDTIKDVLKEIMTEEAADPNGALSPK